MEDNKVAIMDKELIQQQMDWKEDDLVGSAVFCLEEGEIQLLAKEWETKEVLNEEQKRLDFMLGTCIYCNCNIKYKQT